MYTSVLTQIKKRSGEIADFNAEKIAIAIQKAFQEVRGNLDLAMAGTIVEHVISHLEKTYEGKTPSVEDVQNTVENVLMEEGHFDVAKAYIIYRYNHQKIREVKQQEVQKKIEEKGIYVIKRNGQKELFSLEKLKTSIAYYIKGYESVINLDMVANQVRLEMHEDISTKNISRAVIMVLRSFIEQDPAFTYAAARAHLAENYKTVIGADTADFSKLDIQLREAFKNNIKLAVAVNRLDPKMLMFDLDELASYMIFERDNLHEYLSVQTLSDAYYLKVAFDQPVLETPQTFWMRVAMGLALNEKTNREEWAKKFYDVMSTFRYVPSSPTLYHAGTTHAQMSSCYLTTTMDDLGHIFKSFSDFAQLSKWAGGIGHDWTNLRGTGALIKGTGVSSQGVVPFLKIANDTTAAINRSGRRRGATCAYLEAWHWDIEDFLELRKNTGDERRRTHDMDTANWIPDLFMKRVKADQEWSLFSPDETPDLHHVYGKEFEKRYEAYEKKGGAGELRLYKKIKARDLWKKMLTMLFETGHPWITWKDPSNIRSPQDHVGVVHSSNLCTEITLNTSEDETAVCNLGSVNLEEHVVNGKFDFEMLRETVTIGMRMLDNVIDLNYYPTKEALNANMRHRPVGLGLMGFHYALFKLGINFESEDAVTFADQSMEAISYHAILASTNLARERGAYSTFRGSKWDRGILPLDTIALLEAERGETIPVDRSSKLDWNIVREAIKQYGMRNSNCMAMAPTATISNIAGTSPTIEPIYKNMYVKANKAGDFVVVNPYLVKDLKALNLWDAEMVGKIKFHDGKVTEIMEIPEHIRTKYKEVFEIDARHMVKVAAYRMKWIDQSQSFNIFYSGRSGKDLNDIYLMAWDYGLKTTYYLRSLAVSQVEKSTVSTEKYGDTHKRTSSTPVAATKSTVQQPAPTPVQTPSMATAAIPTTATTPSTEVNADGVKLCKISDPDCEACQ